MLTAEQQAFRRTGCGASEVGMVLGLSPWGGPWDVFAAKTGAAPPMEETQAQKRGRILEPAVLQFWAEETGCALIASPGTIRSAAHPLVICTPDALGREAGPVNSAPGDGLLDVADRVVQAKTAHGRTAHLWGPEGTDEVPDSYLLQVQWEMAATGLRRADLAVLLGGDDFRVYRLDFNEALFGYALERVERFWRDHVVTGRPPPLTDSDKAREWLRQTFPKEKRAELAPATPEVEALLADLLEVKASLANLEPRAEALGNQLRALIGDGAGFVGAAGRATWKANKAGAATDWPAVAERLAGCLAARSEAAGVSAVDANAEAAAVLAEAIKQNTHSKPGARVLRVSAPKEQG